MLLEGPSGFSYLLWKNALSDLCIPCILLRFHVLAWIKVSSVIAAFDTVVPNVPVSAKSVWRVQCGDFCTDQLFKEEQRRMLWEIIHYFQSNWIKWSLTCSRFHCGIWEVGILLSLHCSWERAACLTPLKKFLAEVRFESGKFGFAAQSPTILYQLITFECKAQFDSFGSRPLILNI